MSVDSLALGVCVEPSVLSIECAIGDVPDLSHHPPIAKLPDLSATGKLWSQR